MTTMTEIDYDTLFSTNLVQTRFSNFPYAEKFCAYCNKNMTLVKTYHLADFPADYKAIYVCYNSSCEAYDEPAQRAYVKVYYSSELAASMMDNIKSNIYQPGKQ
jgi:hypothetical protein